MMGYKGKRCKEVKRDSNREKEKVWKEQEREQRGWETVRKKQQKQALMHLYTQYQGPLLMQSQREEQNPQMHTHSGKRHMVIITLNCTDPHQ